MTDLEILRGVADTVESLANNLPFCGGWKGTPSVRYGKAMKHLMDLRQKIDPDQILFSEILQPGAPFLFRANGTHLDYRVASKDLAEIVRTLGQLFGLWDEFGTPAVEIKAKPVDVPKAEIRRLKLCAEDLRELIAKIEERSAEFARTNGPDPDQYGVLNINGVAHPIGANDYDVFRIMGEVTEVTFLDFCEKMWGEERPRGSIGSVVNRFNQMMERLGQPGRLKASRERVCWATIDPAKKLQQDATS